ncbi:MAG TPA: DUF5317 domain-containing protein [Mycobacteriales bacterium]|nr:DUF5317 domain-containing protein [Mycobacteriales bacterium]
MALVLVVVVAAGVVATLTRGEWRGFAELQLRAKSLVVAAVAVQVAGAALADHTGHGWCYSVGLATSAACALGFCLANLRVAGIPLVAAGLVLNALVVARNGAMPVSIVAAHRAGVSILSIATGNDPRHTIAGIGSVWRSLGDVIPVPFPVAPEVVSPGDVLVAAGLAEFIVMTSRRRRDADQPAGGDTFHASHALSTMARRS